MMSNIILNFSPSGTYQLRINSGLSDTVQYSEEEFSRVCHEVEALSVPVYLAMIRSIISYSRHDHRSCLRHMQEMVDLLRPALSAYYDRVHDSKIKHGVWLSHVQGFYAWGMGREDDKETGKWVQFDGLSGNQVLLFQAVDAFLGLDVYLSKEMLEGNVPRLQREFCAAVRRSSFRKAVCSVSDGGNGEMEGKIKGAFDELVKRMRVSEVLSLLISFPLFLYIWLTSLTLPGLPLGTPLPCKGLPPRPRPRETPHDGGQVAPQGGHGGEHQVSGRVHGGQTPADGVTHSGCSGVV